MRYEILDGKKIVNTIIADNAFMEAQYPNGNYRLVQEPAMLVWLKSKDDEAVALQVELSKL